MIFGRIVSPSILNSLGRVMEDYNIHIAFHPRDETQFNSALHRINSLMKQLFGDEQSLVYSSSQQKEMIYSIQKPVFKAPDTVTMFFKGLDTIFNTSAGMEPHFVKFEGETE